MRICPDCATQHDSVRRCLRCPKCDFRHNKKLAAVRKESRAAAREAAAKTRAASADSRFLTALKETKIDFSGRKAG